MISFQPISDTVQDSLTDLRVVVGLGRDIQRPGAEVVAATAAGLVLGVVDVEVGFLTVGQRADTTVKMAFAAAGLAAARARVTPGGAADGLRQDHGLCSLDAEVTRRCLGTQALSFKPPSSYAVSINQHAVSWLSSWWG